MCGCGRRVHITECECVGVGGEYTSQSVNVWVWEESTHQSVNVWVWDPAKNSY